MRTKLFLSYARPDISVARELAKRLADAGLEVWFDEAKLLPGQKWRTEIRNAIVEADYFLALVSSRSVDRRGYVQAELRAALETLKEIPEQRIFLIPARLDECRIANPELAELHYVDLFPDMEKGFSRLLASLKVSSISPTSARISTRQRVGRTYIETELQELITVSMKVSRGYPVGITDMRLQMERVLPLLDPSGAVLDSLSRKEGQSSAITLARELAALEGLLESIHPDDVEPTFKRVTFLAEELLESIQGERGSGAV